MYAALDIGGTKTIAALVDSSGQILVQEKFPTLTLDCEKHLSLCVESLHRLLSAARTSPASLSGLGVTLPGIVDYREGILLRAPYADWINVPVAALLRDKLGIERVRCENDVNACALGELYFGLGSRYTDFIWMTVSTGVGGACVSDGRLIRGAQGFAGEMGHLKVEFEKPARCPCGQTGCLEAHGSGTALNRLIEQTVSSLPSFADQFSSAGLPVSAASCAKLAREGNSVAREIFETTGHYLGRGMAYAVNLLNPQAIVVGGGVAASLDCLLPGIRSALSSDVFLPLQQVEVIATPLGYEAALLGAAVLVIDE